MYVLMDIFIHICAYTCIYGQVHKYSDINSVIVVCAVDIPDF